MVKKRFPQSAVIIAAVGGFLLGGLSYRKYLSSTREVTNALEHLQMYQKEFYDGAQREGCTEKSRVIFRELGRDLDSSILMLKLLEAERDPAEIAIAMYAQMENRILFSNKYAATRPAQ